VSYFNNEEALGLPTGSVRAILALLIIAPVTFLALKSGVTLTGDQIVGLASLILTAYFVQKSKTGA
jgi:hypothetical protein